MGIYRIDRPKDIMQLQTEEGLREGIRKTKLDKYDPTVLGLGDITLESKRIDALCAILDLSGFTAFCKQIDPRFTIPTFLNAFLEWFFATLRKSCIAEEKKDVYFTYSDPPFLTKFLGDGLLLIWDLQNVEDISRCNMVSVLFDLCKQYGDQFYPKIVKEVSDAPKAMRCGIARGDVFTVGNGEDFVGACINVAARLQKIGSLSFAVAKRGMLLEKHMGEGYMEKFTVKRATIRGIGDNELIYVLKTECAHLSSEDKAIIRDIP